MFLPLVFISVESALSMLRGMVSPVAPENLRSDCDEFPIIPFANATRIGPYSVEYTCEKGYYSSSQGSQKFTIPCKNIATLTGLPACEKIHCPIILAPENTTPMGPSSITITYLSTIDFPCLFGYSADGEVHGPHFIEYVCSEQGTLTPSSLYRDKCKAITCGRAIEVQSKFSKLVDPIDINVSLTFGEKATFSCEKNTTVGGKTGGSTSYSLKCEADGHFTETNGCDKLNCGVPPLIEGAEAIRSSPVSVGEKVLYTCESGLFVNASHREKSFELHCILGPTNQVPDYDNSAQTKCTLPA